MRARRDGVRAIESIAILPWKRLGAIASVGAATLMISLLLPLPWSQVLSLPAAVALAACLVAALAWLPDSLLGKRVDRALERWYRNRRAGLYGLVALAMFGLLEGETLVTRIAELELSEVSLGKLLAGWFVRVSVDSILNGVFASIWPIQLWRTIAPGPAIACILASLAVGSGAQWALRLPSTAVPPPLPEADGQSEGAPLDPPKV